MTADMRFLHLYAQEAWHDDARIVGNRAALECLRDAITSALAGETVLIEVFASDGEGYDCEVQMDEDISGWMPPYTDKDLIP